ncbi:MAG: rhodanese-like domain-containing protein [bacterium]
MIPDAFFLAGGANPLMMAILFYSIVNLAPEEALKYVGVPEVLILDVRENTEYERGHIPGARLLPWSSGILQERWMELPTDRPILVYCQSGNRSTRAVQFLNEKGFTNLLNLTGGFSSYQWIPGAKVETGPFQEPDTGIIEWFLY